MKNKKEIIPTAVLDEKKKYNIIEVTSIPNIRLFKLYYGDYRFCIKEFEEKYGQLGTKHEIYYWKENKLIFIVDEIIDKIMNDM